MLFHPTNRILATDFVVKYKSDQGFLAIERMLKLVVQANAHRPGPRVGCTKHPTPVFALSRAVKNCMYRHTGVKVLDSTLHWQILKKLITSVCSHAVELKGETSLES